MTMNLEEGGWVRGGNSAKLVDKLFSGEQFKELCYIIFLITTILVVGGRGGQEAAGVLAWK